MYRNRNRFDSRTPVRRNRNRFDSRNTRTAFDLKKLEKMDYDACESMISGAEHAYNSPFSLTLTPEYISRGTTFVLNVDLSGIDNGEDDVDIAHRKLLFAAEWDPQITDVYKAFSKRSLKELQKLGRFDRYYDIFVLEGVDVNALMDFQEGQYITEFVTGISAGLAS